jgi:hypothetical protein
MVCCSIKYGTTLCFISLWTQKVLFHTLKEMDLKMNHITKFWINIKLCLSSVQNSTLPPSNFDKGSHKTKWFSKLWLDLMCWFLAGSKSMKRRLIRHAPNIPTLFKKKNSTVKTQGKHWIRLEKQWIRQCKWMEETSKDRDTGGNYWRDQSPVQAVMPLKKKKAVFKINWTISRKSTKVLYIVSYLILLNFGHILMQKNIRILAKVPEFVRLIHLIEAPVTSLLW